jgi:hydrogenase-4 component E
MGPGAAFAHLLGGAVLVLSFGLLSQRRLAAVITLYALQGWALVATAGWQGWLQGAPALGVAGLIVLGATGVAAPVLLRRIARRSRLHQVVDTALGIFPGLAIGSALVALAVLVVLPATISRCRWCCSAC